MVLPMVMYQCIVYTPSVLILRYNLAHIVTNEPFNHNTNWKSYFQVHCARNAQYVLLGCYQNLGLRIYDVISCFHVIDEQ